MHNLLTALKLTRVADASAAATTALSSASVDMADFDSVLFVVLHGAITDGTPDVKLQQSADNGAADAWADLAGTRVPVADDADNALTLLEVRRPRERYVRCVVERDGVTGSEVDGIVAIQGFGRELPAMQDPASVHGAAIHSSPAEGTA